MGTIVGTFLKPELRRDSEGHRFYNVTFKVKALSGEGPYTILTTTPGLPIPGMPWSFSGDTDINAWCLPDAQVTSMVEDEINYYEVTVGFTTKAPQGSLRRCNDTQVESPLLEAPKIKFGYRGKRQEITKDRFGTLIKNSAHEQVRGAKIEFDQYISTITIEQNIPTYNVAFHNFFQNRVNDRVLYGMPARTVLVKSVEAEERYYGLCYKYYNRRIELEIDSRSFDKDLVDEGNKALKGAWNPTTREWVLTNINGEPPNPHNPLHFDRVLDNKGNPMKVVLDGRGKPFTPQIHDKCSQCDPYYTSPIQLEVLGFYDPELFLFDETAGVPQVILTHSGATNCIWTGSYPGFGGDRNLTLNIVAGEITLISTDEGGVSTMSWSGDLADWDCDGAVELEKDHPSYRPDRVIINNYNQAGLINVQYHEEANLLLLGIPLYIGS